MSSEHETTPAPEPEADALGAGAPADEEVVIDVDVIEEMGVEAAESELDVARRERDEYLDLAQRARADLENYRRRVDGDAKVAEQRGRAAVAKDIIPALDNLERALTAAGVDPDGGSAPDGEPVSREVSAKTALAEGVALVYRELRESLRRAGVESFDPVGEKFDPNRHEAIATAPAVDGIATGHVLEVMERGYAINESVLRPARVVVCE